MTRKQLVLGDNQSSNEVLESAMRGARVVIHLAGRAHIMREDHAEPLAEFRRVNVNGALAIARTAARLGVDRFIFMSSIGVLGNSSGAAPLTENDAPSPQGPYAISKWEAEQALQKLGRDIGLDLVVVRPPLVYGPNVKGNFLRLLRLVRSGLPLPLAAVRNSRSYVGVDNLCGFLQACAVHPAAAGRTFHVADGQDISTPELLTIIANAMGKYPRTFSCPTPVLRALARLVGKREELQRLTSSLRVDSSLARSSLDWRPVKDAVVGIADMVRFFTDARRSS